MICFFICINDIELIRSLIFTLTLTRSFFKFWYTQWVNRCFTSLLFRNEHSLIHPRAHSRSLAYIWKEAKYTTTDSTSFSESTMEMGGGEEKTVQCANALINETLAIEM